MTWQHSSALDHGKGLLALWFFSGIWDWMAVDGEKVGRRVVMGAGRL